MWLFSETFFLFLSISNEKLFLLLSENITSSKNPFRSLLQPKTANLVTKMSIGSCQCPWKSLFLPPSRGRTEENRPMTENRKKSTSDRRGKYEGVSKDLQNPVLILQKEKKGVYTDLNTTINLQKFWHLSTHILYRKYRFKIFKKYTKRESIPLACCIYTRLAIIRICYPLTDRLNFLFFFQFESYFVVGTQN